MTFTAEQRQQARAVRDRLTGRNVVRTKYFQSSSHFDKQYEVRIYADGTNSCNCPGWTRRVGKDGRRTCRHVESV